MWEDLPLFMGDEGALEETLVEGSLRFMQEHWKGLCDASNMFYIYFSAVIFIFDISNASSSFLYLMQRWLSNVISICVQIIKHESPLCAICMLPKCMFYFLLIEDLSQRPSWLFLHISNLCFIYLSMLFIRILCNSSSNFLSMLCLLPHFVFAYFCISCPSAGERPHDCLLPHFRQKSLFNANRNRVLSVQSVRVRRMYFSILKANIISAKK